MLTEKYINSLKIEKKDLKERSELIDRINQKTFKLVLKTSQKIDKNKENKLNANRKREKAIKNTK